MNMNQKIIFYLLIICSFCLLNTSKIFALEMHHPPMIRGMGMRTCHDILDQMKFERNQQLNSEDLQWVLGFITAYNYIKNNDPLRGIHPADISQKVINYCKIERQKTLMDVSIHLIVR